MIDKGCFNVFLQQVAPPPHARAPHAPPSSLPPARHPCTAALGLRPTTTQAGDRPVLTYRSGDSFGELALLYNAPRAATVLCEEDGVLWALERKAFRCVPSPRRPSAAVDSSRRTRHAHPTSRHAGRVPPRPPHASARPPAKPRRYAMQQMGQGNATTAEGFLKTVPLLAPLTDSQRTSLGTPRRLLGGLPPLTHPPTHPLSALALAQQAGASPSKPSVLPARLPPAPPSPPLTPAPPPLVTSAAHLMEEISYNDGEYVVEKGAAADSLFFVKEGELACTTSEHEAGFRIKQGAVFGESCLEAGSAVRKANVVAVGKCKVLKLTRETFLDQCGELETLVGATPPAAPAPEPRAKRAPSLAPSLPRSLAPSLSRAHARPDPAPSAGTRQPTTSSARCSRG